MKSCSTTIWGVLALLLYTFLYSASCNPAKGLTVGQSAQSASRFGGIFLLSHSYSAASVEIWLHNEGRRKIRLGLENAYEEVSRRGIVVPHELWDDSWEIAGKDSALLRVGLNPYEKMLDWNTYDLQLSDQRDELYTMSLAVRYTDDFLRTSLQDSAENALWNMARSADTIPAYLSYLDAYERGYYYDAALDSIRRLAPTASEKEVGDALERTRDVWLAKYYQERFPNGPRIGLARSLFSEEKQTSKPPAATPANDREFERADRRAWERAQARDRIASYEAYLRGFGVHGKFTEEARARLAERRAYEDALRRGNRQAYSNFLRRFPNSRYREDLERRMTPPLSGGATGDRENITSPDTNTIVIDVSPEDFVRGSVSYYLPDSMRVDEWTVVVLVLSRSLSIEQLEEEVREEVSQTIGPLQPADPALQSESQIRLSSKMRATLSSPDPDAFDINIDPELEEQAVDTSLSGRGKSMWHWDVKPNKSGDLPLRLSLSIKVINEFGETPQQVEVFSRRVRVSSLPVATGDSPDKKSDLPWLWIALGLLVLALAVGVFFWSRRRKEGEPAQMMAADGPWPARARAYVQRGQLDEALDILRANGADPNEVTLLKGQLAELKRQEQLDTIDPADLRRNRNRIAQAVMQWVEEHTTT